MLNVDENLGVRKTDWLSTKCLRGKETTRVVLSYSQFYR